MDKFIFGHQFRYSLLIFNFAFAIIEKSTYVIALADAVVLDEKASVHLARLLLEQ